MNFASATNLRRIRRSIHGLTMVELLTAMAVASIFLVGTYTAYIQIMNTQAQAEVRSEAVQNGRTAISTLTTEIKELNNLGEDVLFVGIDGSKGVGDGLDNDLDGEFDEEVVDGKDEDLTDNQLLINDRHARLGSYYERPTRIYQTDLGDIGIDEDVKFGLDQLYIAITPSDPHSMITLKTVRYFITEVDGQQGVLVRRTRLDQLIGDPLIAEAPVAFGVLGFDVLYWDWSPSGSSLGGQWVTEWDSRNRTGANRLPASLYLRLTLNTDARPNRIVADGKPIDSMTMETITNIESVIGSGEFNSQRPNL